MAWTWILKEEWLWLIILALILILVLPLVVIWFILELPPFMRFLVTLVIVVGWGIAAGYKDWIVSKRREEEQSTK